MEKSEEIISDEVWRTFIQAPSRHANFFYKWLQSTTPKPEHKYWEDFISALRWAYLNKSMLDFLKLAGNKLFGHFIGLSVIVIYLEKLLDPELMDKSNIIAGIHHLIAEEFYYEGMGGFLEELKLDMLTEAEKECRRAIEMDPGNLKYRDLLVIILHQGMANNIGALKELEKIIELDTEGSTVYGAKAKENFSYIKKRADVSHVLPPEAIIPFAAGLAHHRGGRVHQAIDEYQQAIELAPNYIPRYQYGVSVEITQNTHFVTDYRSYPYMDKGVLGYTLRLNEARLIISLNDDIHLCLGLAYLRVGERKKAREEFKKVIGIFHEGATGSLIDIAGLMSHAVDDIFANKHNVTDDPTPDKMNNDIKTHKDAGIIDWPVFGGNPARTGRSAETIKPPLRLEWEFPTKSYIEASPVVYDNIIYFGTRDKKFYALDAMTGQKIWEFDTQGMVMSSPVVNDGTIYFTSVGDCLYALEAKSGALLWKFKLSAKSLEQIFSNARSHPLVLNNAKSTFVCLPLSNLSFINSTNGECQDLLSKEVSGVSTPAFCDGILYFAVRSHRLLVALDVFSMKEIWVVSTPRSVRTGPVVSKDFIFYGTKRNVMYGHRIRDGERVWEFHITHEPIYHSCEGIESSPAVFEDTLYFGGPDGWLYALDTLTGLDIWSFNIGSDITSSPLLSGDNLFVSAEGRKLYCFDKNIGEKKWEYGTERGFKSGPVASGNMLYCGSNILYAFSGMDD